MTLEASSQNMLEIHMSTICHIVGNFLLKANTKISHRIKTVFPRKKAMAPFRSFDEDWRNFPKFVTTTKLPFKKETTNCTGEDDTDSKCQSSSQLTLDILQMVVLMKKNHILDLILSEAKRLNSPSEKDWFKRVETNSAEDDKHLAIFCQSTLNLASKFNPQGLYKILKNVLEHRIDIKLTHFWREEPIKLILHNAAINCDSLSAR